MSSTTFIFWVRLWSTIFDATGYRGKMWHNTENICNLEDVFPFADTYIAQVSNLSANCQFYEAWGLWLLSTIMDSEVEKQIECSWPLLFMKNVSIGFGLSFIFNNKVFFSKNNGYDLVWLAMLKKSKSRLIIIIMYLERRF